MSSRTLKCTCTARSRRRRSPTWPSFWTTTRPRPSPLGQVWFNLLSPPPPPPNRPATHHWARYDNQAFCFVSPFITKPSTSGSEAIFCPARVTIKGGSVLICFRLALSQPHHHYRAISGNQEVPPHTHTHHQFMVTLSPLYLPPLASDHSWQPYRQSVSPPPPKLPSDHLWRSGSVYPPIPIPPSVLP